LIEVKNISKSFGDNHVIRNISMSCKEGETNLIIGQSGSGKTVLLKSILGIHEIDKGQIIYGDRIYSDMNHKEKQIIRQEIGMVFQGGALFDSSTVFENVIFPLKMFSKMTKSEMHDRVRFCLDRVNIEDADDLYPSEISGGMQKRVAIARALVTKPGIILADEPTGNLDSKTGVEIMSIFRELHQEGNTIILITHEPEIAEYADRGIVIKDGLIVQDQINKQSQVILNGQKA